MTPSKDLAKQIVPCRSARVAATVAVDVVVVLECSAVVAVALGGLSYLLVGRLLWSWASAGALVGALLGSWLAWVSYGRYGRMAGGILFGTRRVDDAFFLPKTLWPGGTRSRGAAIIVDIRRGMDPIGPLLAPWPGSMLAPSSSVGGQAETAATLPGGASAGSIALVFDTGQVHWFSGVCVVGRSPVALFGEDALSLPDLSRELMPSHLMIGEDTGPEGKASLWATDQGSEAGTWLNDGSGARRLPSKTRVWFQPGAMIRMGEYRMRVERTRT